MNLTQLYAAIQAKGYTTDTQAQQLIELNGIYREICGEQRWMFLEAQDTNLTTVAGTSAYALPASMTTGAFTWRSLDACRLQIAGIQQYNNLKYMPVQDFREYEHIDRDQSTPYYWTWYANAMHFFPVPDSAYTAVIDYIIQPLDLAQPTDVPVLPLAYHDILVWGAVEGMCFRERDWLGRQFADTKKEALLKKMEEEYLIRQRQTSSHVKKSGFWETQLPYPFTQSGF